MAGFRERIRTLLSEYKMLVKKYLARNDRVRYFKQLGVDRNSLKYNSEVALYRAAEQVIKDLEGRVIRSEHTASWYSGLDEFKQHLSDLLSHYRVEGKLVIHMSQTASVAIVKAIQIMSLPNEKLNAQTVEHLQRLTNQVLCYGNKDQQKQLMKALQQQSKSNPNLYLPILDDFQLTSSQGELTESV